MERLREKPSLWRDLSVETETAGVGQPPELNEVLKEMRGMLDELRRLVDGGA